MFGKSLIFLFFCTLLTFAANATSTVFGFVDLLYTLLFPLMGICFLFALALYAIGSMFGPDLKAKTHLWSYRIIGGILISVALLVLFGFIVPNFAGPNASVNIDLTGGPGDTISTIMTTIVQPLLISLISLMILLACSAYVIGQLYGADMRAKANVWAQNLVVATILVASLYTVLTMLIPTVAKDLTSGPAGLGIQYLYLVINVSLLMGFIILITYLISKVLKIPEWEAYLTIELSNLTVSFLIVIFIIAFFAGAQTIAKTFIPAKYNTADTPAKAGVLFIDSQIKNSIVPALNDINKLQYCTSLLSTISKRYGDPVITDVVKIFPGVDMFVSISGVLSYGLISAYGSLSAQLLIMSMIDSLVPFFILPAGLILRFFPATRDPGAFLIAVSFGFQIILPTVYLINGQIFEGVLRAYDSAYGPLIDRGTYYDSPTTTINSLCGIKHLVVPLFVNPAISPLFSGSVFGRLGFTAGGTANRILDTLTTTNKLNLLSMSEFIYIAKHIGILSLLSVFIPGFSMVVTMTFITALTNFIKARF